MPYNGDKEYLKEQYHKGIHWLLDDRSKKIVELFKKYATSGDSILELGCSSGRNLIALKEAGFENLTGLEMSDVAVKDFKFPLIHGKYEEVDHGEYDIIFSASFLQEFPIFPQEQFDKTLKMCRKYFMIFGDYMGKWEHEGFEVIETINNDTPFTQPIIILCRKQ